MMGYECWPAVVRILPQILGGGTFEADVAARNLREFAYPKPHHYGMRHGTTSGNDRNLYWLSDMGTPDWGLAYGIS